jgi:hypothetical protein
MVEMAAKEISDGKTKSALAESREHHNFFSVGCWGVLHFSRPPLEHSAVWEEVILIRLEDLTLCHSELLQHVWMRGGHGEGKENLGRVIKCVGKETKCARTRNGDDSKGWLRVRPRSHIYSSGSKRGT